jgi:sec-independent protein translocase protein TatC
METTTQRMTLLEHILELRNRLMWAAGAVLITTILAFVFATQLFEFMTWPAGNLQFVYITVPSMITIYMQVCLTAGIIVSMPFLIYQFIMYVSPGLMPHEKKYVYLIIPWIFLMFLAGVAFGYFVFLPKAIEFLTTFGNDIATPMITIDSYIGFLTRMLLVLGLIFELPVITTFLARLGMLTSKWLLNKWKIAIVGSFIAAAIITPTPDPISQTIVAAPLIVLYFLSIWLAKLVEKKKVQKAVAETEEKK